MNRSNLFIRIFKIWMIFFLKVAYLLLISRISNRFSENANNIYPSIWRLSGSANTSLRCMLSRRWMTMVFQFSMLSTAFCMWKKSGCGKAGNKVLNSCLIGIRQPPPANLQVATHCSACAQFVSRSGPTTQSRPVLESLIAPSEETRKRTTF